MAQLHFLKNLKALLIELYILGLYNYRMIQQQLYS